MYIGNHRLFIGNCHIWFIFTTVIRLTDIYIKNIFIQQLPSYLHEGNTTVKQTFNSMATPILLQLTATFNLYQK